MAKFKTDGEKLSYMAKLAEKTRRFDYMFEKMKMVAKMGVKLDDAQMSMLALAYKKVVGNRGDALAILWDLEENEEPNDAFVEYMEELEKEATEILQEMLPIIDQHLFLSATTKKETMFYNKMKGDNYRYLAYITSPTGDGYQNYADLSSEAYKAATCAGEESPCTDAIRLAVALNYSVFHYHILSKTESALLIAKKAYAEAKPVLKDLIHEDAHKQAIDVMCVLNQNIRLWTSEPSEGGNKTGIADDIGID